MTRPISDHRDQARPAAWWIRSLRVEEHLARAERALAEPFRGVTTDGQVVPGLFSLQQTGVSTRPMKDAADAFIASLTAAQQKVALHPIDSQEWRKWTNWEQYPLRHGVSLDQMSASQRDAALELLRVSLSVRGFETARNVMKLNEVLGEITGNWEFFGEWFYFLCIFGTPSMDEPWGWQIDGHHLNLNLLRPEGPGRDDTGLLGRRAGHCRPRPLRRTA